MVLWIRTLLAYAAGTVLQSAPGIVGWLAALILLFGALVIRQGWSLRLAPSWGVVALPALALGAAGTSKTSVLDLPLRGDAIVEGWVTSAPESRAWGDSGWLQVESLQVGEHSRRPHSMRLRVYARERLPPYGRPCRLSGTLRPGRGPRNFDGFDERGVLAAHDAAAVLLARRVERLEGERGAAWRREIVEPLRTSLAAHIDRTLAPAEASLLKALVLGMDASIDASLHETWRALGLAHVLAVSGMHVGLVAAAILILVGAPRRRPALLLLWSGVGLYAVLGGLAPSVLRASLMTVWAALAVHLGRPLSGPLALTLASATLLASTPSLRFDLGFQLSCAATLGIVVWARPIHALLRRIQGLPLIGKPLAFGIGSASISLAAQLSTLPLVLWKFGYLSRAGLLSNLCIVPLANGALVLGLAGAPWSLLEPSICRSFWILAGALLHGAIRVGQGLTSFGEPRCFLPTRTDVLALAVEICLAVLLAGSLGTNHRWRLCGAALFLAMAGIAGIWVAVQHPRLPRWRLEALDVGQGDALLLRLGTHAWLVDAGNVRPRDQGKQTVLPHLRRAGIERLRGMVLTHPHEDHMGGALAVLQGIPVDTLYLAAVSRQSQAYAPLRDTAVPQRWLQAGERLRLGPSYEALVLWPYEADSLASGANGESLVLWARGRDNPQWLAMGDLESDGEAALLSRWGEELRAAASEFLVLKAGHHGSRTSSTTKFLDSIGADVALICVGEDNRYGHPAPETLGALAARQCRVLRTDQGGAIRLDRRGETLWLERPGATTTLLVPMAAGKLATTATANPTRIDASR